MKSAKKNKVGFIGLGIMGKPMVINLIKNDIEVYFYARKKRIIDEILRLEVSLSQILVIFQNSQKSS